MRHARPALAARSAGAAMPRTPPRAPAPGRRGGDTGAGTVLALGIVAVTLIVAVTVLGLAAALAERARLAGAADSAALAAADAARGLVPGVPCEVAARVASGNGARLASCELDGVVVTVTLRSEAVLPLEARSRAGPPP